MYDSTDLKRLGELMEHAPEDFNAWVNLDRITQRKDGKIGAKARELIAVAVAHTTQCPYCIEVHVKAAKKEGASKAEVAEAIFVAAALRAGGAAAHGGMAMKIYDQK